MFLVFLVSALLLVLGMLVATGPIRVVGHLALSTPFAAVTNVFGYLTALLS